MEGVGMVLSQLVHQVILFAFQKFSDQARRWSTIEQEAYAVFWSVKTCEFYLRFKPFVLESDHANLQWMEASLVAKVIRWRIYLQGFTFMLRHIPGKRNAVADWLSRNHPDEATPGPPETSDVRDPALLAHFLAVLTEENDLDPSSLMYEPYQCAALASHAAAVVSVDPVVSPPSSDPTLPAAADPITAPPVAVPTPEDLLSQVHGGRMGHHGARKTWKSLNEHFPGHRIPYRVVEDFVSSCAICQKDRLGMTDALQPVYRTLQSGQKRRTAGVDTLTVTPTDKFGNTYIIVVVKCTRPSSYISTPLRTSLPKRQRWHSFASSLSTASTST